MQRKGSVVVHAFDLTFFTSRRKQHHLRKTVAWRVCSFFAHSSQLSLLQFDHDNKVVRNRSCIIYFQGGNNKLLGVTKSDTQFRFQLLFTVLSWEAARPSFDKVTRRKQMVLLSFLRLQWQVLGSKRALQMFLSTWFCVPIMKEVLSHSI